MFHIVRRWFSLEVLFRPLRSRKRRPSRHLSGREAFLRTLEKLTFESLESRQMLYGYIDAQNDPMYGGGDTVLNTTPFTVAAPGVLANDTGGTAPLTPHLASQPAHGSITLNSDGSFTYTAAPGYTGPDSCTYYDTDSEGDPSSTATIFFTVYAGALSDVDQTKLPADTLSVPRQILGTSSGQPGTADNLSLVYHSSTAQPTQTLEQDWQLSLPGGTSDELQVLGSINGLQPAAAYVNTSSLSQNNPVIRLSVEVDTSSLPTGRYADSQTVNTMVSQGNIPISTLDGAVNVVNDQSSPFGAGWEMPGLYHLYQNTAANVPAGVLLTPGDGTGWYFTQAGGNSYSSPNGPFAFDTLTSLSGGGWQLVDKFGTTYTFNSSGYLTSTELRTTATTDYGWAGSDLTSITDPFGRSVELAYSNGVLSTITNYAGSVWSFGHSGGATLTSITEPAVAAGSPEWTFGYNANLISSVHDPNQNASDYAFNQYNNLSGDTLPGGAGETYGSEQNYGYGGPNQGQNTNAVLASSVYNSTTDANGNTSYDQTNQFGEVTTYVSPYGDVTTYQRNANGLVTQLTQPPPATGDAAPVTDFTYDTLGNQTLATGAQPSYGTTVYNAFSEPVSFTNTSGDEWVWSYDTHGNLVSKTLPSGDTTSYTVDTLGNRLTMTQPAPNWTAPLSLCRRS
ncbi:MAG TPA: Ig-like domain-containing protein [Pirellulales bacterium]